MNHRPRPDGLPPGKAALIVGHPGHELRVFHFLERARPTVFVLTDGSGPRGEGRLDATSAILRRTGSRAGPLYGAFTDRGLYRLVLDGQHDVICRLVDDLAALLLEQQIDYVVGDACEGYNPTHDLCRLVIGAAVAVAGRRRAAAIGNYDFPLTGLPSTGFVPGAVRLRLDEAEFARKIAAARGYRALRHEVEDLDRRYSLEPFREECLRPVAADSGFDGPAEMPPFYETYGRRQVAAGTYRSLLTYAGHVRPAAEALRRHAFGVGQRRRAA